jgi:hypothetical protein
MPRILLKEAQPGMSLAADALNAQQMLLLKKGVLLTEKSLSILKSWGVETIAVEDSNPENTEATSPPANNSDDIEHAILSQFGDTTDNPIMAEICCVAAGIVHERSRTT